MAFDALSKAQAEAIRKIEPSISRRGQLLRPCMVVLQDGSKIERAPFAEDSQETYSEPWIVPSYDAEIQESPFRMPASLAMKLYMAGESGSGYATYRMDLRSGQPLVFVATHIVDFPDLPSGVTTQDIVDVHPHQAYEEIKPGGYRGSADFVWCYYVPYDKAEPPLSP